MDNLQWVVKWTRCLLAAIAIRGLVRGLKGRAFLHKSAILEKCTNLHKIPFQWGPIVGEMDFF